jgi:molybdenum cofactor biosynthesis protein B
MTDHDQHDDDSADDHHGDPEHDHDSHQDHDSDGSHNHHHDDGHGDHDHHHHDADEVAVALFTITSSRDTESDEGGQLARSAIEADGHTVVAYDTVPDDTDAVRERVRGSEADAVITTGGTGLTPDDVTVDALTPLFDRELPGFGEYFRRRSHEQVGTKAMLSRATAGVMDDTVVYVLPGSTAAVELGVRECILPEISHTVGLVQRE